jgi:hypothetical protein
VRQEEPVARVASKEIAGTERRATPRLRAAVAALFIQRMFTAYLPPIWGWATLAWMRRREYV